MPENSSYRYANTRSVVRLRILGLALCLLLLGGALTAGAASAGTRDPRVTFTVTPTSPIAGQPATFDAGGTRCYGSGAWSSVNCASYTWTDDGDPNAPLDAPMWSLGSGRVTKFTFAEGPWTVWLWLTVRDRAGRQTRVMKRVDVRASQPAPPPQPEPDPEPQPEPPPPPSGSCDTVVSSTSAATSAVAAAASGTRVCLADGTYGGITLGAAKSDYVTLAAQNPGKALVRGQVTFAGSARKLRIEGFDIQSSNIGVLVNPGAQGIAIERNHVHDTPYEIEIQDAERGQPATDFEVKDVLVRGNRLSRPSENAIRASGFDGLVIENNEITGCVEDGAHVDGFQAMFGGRGLVFRRNYFHDNNCQNFFMADGTYYDVVHEDNLYIRNDAPASLPIGQTVNLYSIVDGPDADSYGLVSRHNTSWTAPGNDAVLYQGGPWSQALVTDEVYYRVHASPGPAATTGNNVWCKWENPSPTFPGPGPGSTQNCGPAFRAPASDDYRLAGGQGVTWSPADYRYGP